MVVGSFPMWRPCALKDLRSRLSDETLRRGVIAFRLDGGGRAPAQEHNEYGSGGPDVHLTLRAGRLWSPLGYANCMSDTKHI
jgi:hypothetical protein